MPTAWSGTILPYLRNPLAALLLLGCAPVWAEQVYLEPEAYVAQQLPQAGDAKSLWITGDLRAQTETILGHRPLALRQRYWQSGSRSIWILEEIGKEEPITAGFVVEDDRLIDTRVLVFRESRGWEIRYPQFTAQFDNATIDSDLNLDRTIDGISGATLSVNAMRKLARLALIYHRHVNDESATVSSRNRASSS